MKHRRDKPQRHSAGDETNPYILYERAKKQLRKGQPEAALASIQAAKDAIARIRTALQPRPVRLYPASVKTTRGVQWGYINERGRMVIPPRFQWAEAFQENGLAVVQEGGKSGVINLSGRYVIPPRYETIQPFSEGRAPASNEQGYWVLDEEGRVVTSKPYRFISGYQEGRAQFTAAQPEGGDRYGYLDREGREVIPARFAAASDFSGGKALVQLVDGRYALIGKNGEQLQTYSYPFVGFRGDGLLAYQAVEGGRYGYIDEAGNVVIPPAFTAAQAFSEGRAVVNASDDPLENRYGLIDRSGNYVIQPQYNDIRLLGEGRVAVGRAIQPSKPYVGSVYALADLNGRMLTDFRWVELGDFRSGLASASDGRTTFFIDRRGRVMRNMPIVPGSGSLTLMEPLVQANVNQRISYYSRSGRLVWRQNTVIPLAPPYRVREEMYNPAPDYLVYYPQIEGMRNRAAQTRVNDRLRAWSRVPRPAPDPSQPSTYSGDFSVAYFRKTLVVLELEGYEYPLGAAHGMPTRMHANIDLKSGAVYRLQDLFLPGSDYVRVLSEIVGRQIATDPQYSYVFPDAYKGIRPDQPFYVTTDALHLYFAPYEIAPYAAGFPTFTIPFVQIAEIIDRNGAFWRSFH